MRTASKHGLPVSTPAVCTVIELHAFSSSAAGPCPPRPPAGLPGVGAASSTPRAPPPSKAGGEGQEGEHQGLQNGGGGSGGGGDAAALKQRRLSRSSLGRPVPGDAHFQGTSEAYGRLWRFSGPLTKDPELTNRRVQGALLGALLADAAAVGTQGVFDQGLLLRLARAREEAEEHPCGLEFLHPPRGALSRYRSGRGTVLGDQARVVLHSLCHEGGLSCAKYAALNYKTFAATEEATVLDGSTEGFLRNYAAGMQPPYTGVSDAQASCLTRVIPLVCLLAGDPQLPAAVEQLIRTTQDSEAAVAWGSTAARLLEGLLLGRSAVAALRGALAELLTNAPGVDETSPVARLNAEVRRGLGQVLVMCEAGRTPREALAALGRHSYLPTALLTPVFLLLSVEQAAGSAHAEGAYGRGVRLALLGGGDTASRAMFLGACLGAAGGLNAIPPRWQKRFRRTREVLRQAEALCALRGQGAPHPAIPQGAPATPQGLATKYLSGQGQQAEGRVGEEITAAAPRSYPQGGSLGGFQRAASRRLSQPLQHIPEDASLKGGTSPEGSLHTTPRSTAAEGPAETPRP